MTLHASSKAWMAFWGVESAGGVPVMRQVVILSMPLLLPCSARWGPDLAPGARDRSSHGHADGTSGQRAPPVSFCVYPSPRRCHLAVASILATFRPEPRVRLPLAL